MEMKLKGLMIVGIVMMCMVVLGEAAVTCGSVATAMGPCIPYLRSPSASVPAGCCSGIRSLNGQAATTADRRTACNCLKSAAKSISGINYKAAAGLPGKCGVSISYPISPNTDCR
ncbi:non-specific lipid-transfer protein 1-like isoform X2 [Cucumis melo]|uniref:Non-specific lipid-transfer protein n=1 Tax=Cucumis melo TaxID=3656 RepID=A0ABM3KR26_CUCME|nr:non-specific lipid-transfer protein 1-like isoform X2 [Cucumis melo]